MPPTVLPLAPSPAMPVDAAVREAMDRHHLELVDAATFDDTYDRLAAYFGPSAEIEPREALRAELAAPRRRGDVDVVYLLVRVVDRDGDVVAVGDGRYVVAPDLVLGLGSNFFTDPARRGGKVASAVDLASKRPFLDHVAAVTGRSADVPALVAADVEPLSPDDPVTRRRLELWGRCHWRILPPRAFPFALLGQADPAAPDHLLPPVPNLLMVRSIDGTPLDALDRPLLRRLADLLAATAGDDVPAEDVRGWRSAVDAALGAWDGDVVPLLRLPTRDAGPEVLAPLLRSTLLAAVPSAWRRGEEPRPADEARAIGSLPA